MKEIFNVDKTYKKGLWSEEVYNISEKKVYELLNKKVRIRYNYGGREKTFNGIIKQVKYEKFNLKQNFQEIRGLFIGNILKIEI